MPETRETRDDNSASSSSNNNFAEFAQRADYSLLESLHAILGE